MKPTFKIEMTEKEKNNRDKFAQSVYHMNEGMRVEDTIFKGEEYKSNLIQLEDEDVREIQEYQLEKIAEEGQRESSDDGDQDEVDPEIGGDDVYGFENEEGEGGGGKRKKVDIKYEVEEGSDPDADLDF